jgi:hypothetical protein
MEKQRGRGCQEKRWSHEDSEFLRLKLCVYYSELLKISIYFKVRIFHHFLNFSDLHVIYHTQICTNTHSHDSKAILDKSSIYS